MQYQQSFYNKSADPNYCCYFFTANYFPAGSIYKGDRLSHRACYSYNPLIAKIIYAIRKKQFKKLICRSKPKALHKRSEKDDHLIFCLYKNCTENCRFLDERLYSKKHFAV